VRTGKLGRAVVLMVVAGTIWACREKESAKDAAEDVGQQTPHIAADTVVIRQAQAAVNEVVRKAPDCPAARAAMEEARVQLDEAAEKVKTIAGRATLDTLEKQLARIAELCP